MNTSTVTLFAAVVALFAMSACSVGNVRPGGKDYPQENPAPKKLLLLHGTIDTALDIDFRIQWQAENPRCLYATNQPKGAHNWYTAWSPLAISREGTSFSAQVPIDGVLPGRCDWHFDGVTFGGRTGYRTPLIAIDSNPLRPGLQPGQSPNGIAELHCRWGAMAATGERTLVCRWPRIEDRSTSVLGGKLWWRPEATDLEVHFISDQP